MADDKAVPSDIRGKTRLSGKEAAEMQRMEEELRKMSPEAIKELEAEYQRHMSAAQRGAGGSGGLTIADLFIEVASQVITNSVIITAGAPFMRVSLLSCIHHELVRQGQLTAPYLGIADCVSSLVEKEGWRSLFRGVLLDIGLLVPQKIAETTVIPIASGLMERVGFSFGITYESSAPLLIGFSLASLAVVQLTASAVLHPIEVISQRYQTDVKATIEAPYEFESGIDCARKLQKRSGFLGLYTGFGLSAMSLVSYKLIYFFGHEFGRQVAQPGTPFGLFVGVSVAMGAMALTHPFDVVRQRMNASVGNRKPYGSMRECFDEIVGKEGVAGLFSGLRTRLLFAVGSTLVRVPLGI